MCQCAGRGASAFALALSFLLVACPRKSAKHEQTSKEVAPAEDAAALALDERFDSQKKFGPLFEKKLSVGVDAPWGGLTLHKRGSELSEADTILILLHGYGAPGDDLVSLSEVLVVSEQTAFLFPEAPYALPPLGRAWGPIVGDRYGRAFEESRKRIISLLRDVRAENKEAPLVIGGFSQGAIMSLNLLTQTQGPPAAVVLLSPTHLFKHRPLPGGTRPAIFISHGKADQVLPFQETLRLRAELEGHGYPVKFVPFDGGHSIPPVVRGELGRFLAKVH